MNRTAITTNRAAVPTTRGEVALSRRRVNNFGGYSFNLNSGSKITIPTNFSPAAVGGWTLITVFKFTSLLGSVQNIHAQEDGAGIGRIWSLIRADGTFSSFLGGAFQDSTQVLDKNSWYMLMQVYGGGVGTDLNFYLGDYRRGTLRAAGVQTTVVAAADGAHIIGQSKTGGSPLSGAHIAETLLLRTRISTLAEAQEFFRNPAFLKQDTVFHLPITAGSGLSLTDASGNTAPSIATGGTWSVETPMKARSAI